MARTSLDLFPTTNWKTAAFTIYPGNNVTLILTDDTDNVGTVIMFNHDNKDSSTNNLAKMLKEAINKLPITCECCGQEVCDN